MCVCARLCLCANMTPRPSAQTIDVCMNMKKAVIGKNGHVADMVIYDTVFTRTKILLERGWGVWGEVWGVEMERKFAPGIVIHLCCLNLAFSHAVKS